MAEVISEIGHTYHRYDTPNENFFRPFSTILTGDLPPWHAAPLAGHVQHSYSDDEVEDEYDGECSWHTSSAVAFGKYTRDGEGDADTR